MESNHSHQRFWIAKSDEIKERTHTLFVCKYKGDIHTAFVFRFDGKCLAYLNKCVHMPFRLDCEKNSVFSDSKNNLKCSMHGIIYDPVTGESLSPTMCTGEKLIAIKIVENENSVWVEDECVETVLNSYVEGVE